MGACYSKNVTEGVPASPDKLPRQRLRNSKRDKRKSTDATTAEAVPLTDHKSNDENKGSHKPAVTKTEVGRPATPDLVPDLLDDKFGDRGVAPSDSGIESIGTLHEDAQENAVQKREREELSKRLERLSRGSCHKCGNFKLDDSAWTALLADTYCLCGPRQAGKPSINPQCQTHGVKKTKRSVSSVEHSDNSNDLRSQKHNAHHAGMSSEPQNSSDDSELKSSLKSANTPKKDRSVRISVRSVESLDLALTLLSSMENGKSDFSEIFGEDKDSVKAPLAEFDSVDTILADSPLHRNEKRRSLLSEILDITDSICKCDFYSNEYCCSKDHSENGAFTDLRNDTDTHDKLSENTLNGVAENNSDANHTNGDTSFETLKGDSSNSSANNSKNEIIVNGSSQRVSLASKKSSSLPKNVSFAAQQETDFIQPGKFSPCKATPKSDLHQRHFESSISDASSGIYTQSGASGSFYANGLRDTHIRSASLGSGGALIFSDSSSDAPEMTEDDMTSVDLDSLSRVTSLSYSSIRQLVESTEDLVSPLDTARRMTVDGVDCVVIPTETYRQMLNDLAMLKQQLVCLSSLIQEEAEGMELKFDESMDTSMSGEPSSSCRRMLDNSAL